VSTTLLKHIRQLAGLSTGELGQLSGIPQPAVSLIENGRLKPSPRQLEALARTLRVSPPAALLEDVRLIDSQQAIVEQVQVVTA
jgi:transcriptional regulator with XRE-family HTH domain